MLLRRAQASRFGLGWIGRLFAAYRRPWSRGPGSARRTLRCVGQVVKWSDQPCFLSRGRFVFITLIEHSYRIAFTVQCHCSRGARARDSEDGVPLGSKSVLALDRARRSRAHQPTRTGLRTRQAASSRSGRNKTAQRRRRQLRGSSLNRGWRGPRRSTGRAPRPCDCEAFARRRTSGSRTDTRGRVARAASRRRRCCRPRTATS
jgi:hypothetical protein